MKNALEELADHIKDIKNRTIKCATISNDEASYIITKDLKPNINLKVNHTEEELQSFLSELNFSYDNGYGGQELFGIIWYTDGTWSERGEYDGSEWWEHHVCPKIPQELV
jgi:hypothetical protein